MSWRCVSRLEKKKSGIDCPARTIFEKDMHAAVVTSLNQMIEQKDEFLPGMRMAVEMALAQSNGPRVAVFFASLFCRKLQNKNVGCCKTVL